MYKKITFCACIIVICLTCSAWSAVVYNQWSGGAGTSDWNTAGNWALGYVPDILAPNLIDNVKAGFKTPTGPVLGPGTTDAAAYQITLGGVSGGIVTMNGGTLHVEQYIAMGVSAGEDGTLAMNSGIITVGGSGSQKYFVGQAGTGTINMNGGTISIPAELTIADTTGSTGTVNLNGGVITASVLQMNKSGGATAKLDISGGTLILDANQIASIDGFVADANVLLVAYNGAGTVIRDYNVTNPGETTVTIDANLSWTAGDEAVSHDVYFGTDPTPDGNEFQGNQTSTTFDPCVLTPDTTYYWQIDEVNSTHPNSPWIGGVWMFTTGSLIATLPNPADGANDVSVNATLSWTAGVTASSHDVYFGTDPTPDGNEFMGNQTSTTFDPSLTVDTTYYWRIDEVEDGNTYTGDVWSFTTSAPPEVYPYLSWRNDPTNSIVVNWWNPITTGDSSVDYGLTSSYDSNEYVATATNFHSVELTGLTPATTYHYRIRSSDGTVGSDNTFTTSDVNVTSFSFAVYGSGCRLIRMCTIRDINNSATGWRRRILPLSLEPAI
jgi:hypothetical protein